MSLENLQIAALLHDIGKFYQRTDKKHDDHYNRLSTEDYGYNGAHGKWSASFCSEMGLDDQVVELVLYHHQPKKSGYVEMAKVLQKADHHSSKERVKSGEKKEVKKEPIISVFSKVNLNQEKNDNYYLPLKKLDIDATDFMPKSFKEEAMGGWNLQESYKKLWNAFEQESKKINSQNDFNTLYYLLKKYTSLIPSAVYVDEPDISLFDHSKTTSALATCLYYYLQENGELPHDDDLSYLVISGDISGIQDFIYKISSPQEAQKGLSKRLRGRSFYLTLLNDAIAHRIIQDIGLSEANILFCGGGHFTIIAPKTSEALEKIVLVKKDVNESLFANFGSDIYLALSTLPCSGTNLGDFGSLMDQSSYQNQRQKRQKFKKMLGTIFATEKNLPTNICPVCANKKDDHNSFCKSCTQHEDLGRKIANARYIIRSVGENPTSEFQEFGLSYWLAQNPTELHKILKKSDSHCEVLKLNNINFMGIKDLKSENKFSAGFSFMGNTVPRHSHDGTLFFSHLAEISKGANKLGILKMDVDNLGKIFAHGLDNPTISRVSTLSSFLDYFFSGYINHLARKYRVLEKVCSECKGKVEVKNLVIDDETESVEVYREIGDNKVCDKCSEFAIPTIYTVYSGGDDLLVLGPYDDIIAFAQDLREDFKTWTCFNKDINLSAGIFLAGPKFPVERAVKNADQYLELSKEEEGKDSVSIFSETLKWDTQDFYKGFMDLFKFGLKLENLNKEGKISKGMVYSMLLLWEGTFGGLNTASNDKSRIQRRNYVPLFKYKLRTVKDRKVREELNHEGLKFMPWIRVPASWVSLRTR